MSKILVVVGATGSQGGSVVRHLCNNHAFRIRALTRNANSDKAKTLKALAPNNIDLVECDLWDNSKLVSAFKGAHSAFVVTNFWDPSVRTREEELGKRIADVAKSENVRHLIWSSLDNVAKITNNTIHVPHFTLKNKVEEYIKSINVPATFVYAGFYLQNFESFFIPRNVGDHFEVRLPLTANKKVPFFDVQDTGVFVHKVLESGDSYLNKRVNMATFATPEEVVKAIAKKTNKDVRYVKCTYDEFPVKGEILDMLRYIEEYGYFPETFKEQSKEFEAATSVQKWIEKASLTF
ncbi:NmrA-like protein [Rozella allomycis CSF55]|uniref:NmrA-like protein n=1 Tax=Rozella allomycis (strain CSF55) TaxID=988480 RepID=A0A4P9YK36_ROZAC|nr:NmrA-like protein [Rozella allomycis CSF55]